MRLAVRANPLRRLLHVLPWLAGLAACSGEDTSGHTWALTLTGLENGCTDAPLAEPEKLDYRVQIEGQDITLAVGPDEFATGQVNGCVIAYETVVWGEDVDGYEIRWQIHGGATITFGDESCSPSNGTDWDGQERFEVVSSENPSISPGCEVVVALAGKYTGQVK